MIFTYKKLLILSLFLILIFVTFLNIAPDYVVVPRLISSLVPPNGAKYSINMVGGCESEISNCYHGKLIEFKINTSEMNISDYYNKALSNKGWLSIVGVSHLGTDYDLISSYSKNILFHNYTISIYSSKNSVGVMILY